MERADEYAKMQAVPSLPSLRGKAWLCFRRVPSEPTPLASTRENKEGEEGNQHRNEAGTARHG